jgi:pentatricopeptide repeat protein
LQPDIANAKRFALVENGSIKDAAQVFEKLRKTGFRLPALP